MVSEGYKSQAPIYTKALIATFAAGLVIGTLIGWGAATSRNVPPAEVVSEVKTPPGDTAETTDAAPPPPMPAPAPEETATASATPPPSPTPAEVETPAEPGPPFQPDVKGLWPAEHLFVGIQGTTADLQTQELLNEFKPGGVILGPENVSDPLQLAALVLQIKQAVGMGTTMADPPTILYQDKESDLPRILEDAVTTQLAGLDGNAAIDRAVAAAVEAQKQGIAAILGPTLNLASAAAPLPDNATREALEDRANEIIGSGMAYANGLRAAGILAVPGIFPGEGVARGEANARQIPAEQLDLLAATMQPFKAAIDGGLPGILVGHVAVPGIDVEQPNRPASISPKLLQLLLRQEWGFEGVILASDITRDPMVRDVARDEMALKALVSGCDAVILSDASRADLRLICDTFVRLSKRTDFPMDQIQASKSRLDAWRSLLAQSPAPAPVQIADASKDPAPNGETDADNSVSITPPETPAPAATEATPPAEVEPEKPSEPEQPALPAETPEVETSGAEMAAPEAAEVKTENATDSPAEATPPAVEATEPPKSEESTTPEAATPPKDEPAMASAETGTEVAESPEPAVETEKDTEAAPAEGEASGEPLESAAPDESDAVPAPPAVPEGASLVEHTIAKGESLTFIANKYSVALSDLRAWNELEDDNIKYGRKLKVYTTTGPDLESVEEAPEAPATDASSATEQAIPDTTPEPARGEGPLTEEAMEAKEGAITGSEPAENEGAPTVEASDPLEDPAQKPEPAPAPEGTERRDHKVIAGETIESIADEYGVTMAELLAWNGKTSGQLELEVGSVLAVYLPVAEGNAETAAKPAAEPKPDPKPEPAPGTFEVYEVVSGDNLRRISGRFGTTQKAIMEMNNLDSADHVEIGWKLKIPKSAGAPQDSPDAPGAAAPEVKAAPPEGEAANN